MKVLSIDTSSNICGVSILDNTNLLCNLDKNTDRTHSENLMPMINEALNKVNLNPSNIDLLVCDIGPGSFTGIRIGVATAKAFSDSLNIPCVGINSLEALAYGAVKENTKYICSILDCKNDNCYFALYKKTENNIKELISPCAEDIKTALDTIKNFDNNLSSEEISFVGDGSKIYKNEIISNFTKAIFLDDNFDILNSYTLGVLGLNKYNSSNSLPEVLPLYLKKPQAERQLEEKK